MEKGSIKKYSKQDQSSPGVLKGSQPPQSVGYETQSESIDDLPTDSIQPCPYIPDYKTLTLSTHPIVVQTPEACSCIDGWHYIEQAKANGLSTIRSHIFEIKSHSDIELAIRKAAIRVMPLGGKCSYAELVRNAHRLRQALENTSDDGVMMFTHGGDRRGVGFTDSKASNVRVVLANRLGKSPTTISKYLQHGDGLTEAALQELVNSGAPKKFFEVIQEDKQAAMVILQSEQKDPAVIAEAISKKVLQWLAESLEPEPPETKQEGGQPQQTERSASRERPAPNGNRGSAPTPRNPRNGSDGYQDPSASDLTPTVEDGVAADDHTPTDETAPAVELKKIGEALIEIADNQESPTPQQIERIRSLIFELSTLLSRIATPIGPEEGEAGGAV